MIMRFLYIVLLALLPFSSKAGDILVPPEGGEKLTFGDFQAATSIVDKAAFESNPTTVLEGESLLAKVKAKGEQAVIAEKLSNL